ncbi:hypothetical protein K437DRAFT_100831 [Tilletiaria anomala UBC 951]|uniref:Uncharacterized protein n=1 Tax=Tilletiaria anomala (strain ATCC 24038 / CBS 436.72 / UBC 951) TaxID=1037660 RepID=A0A066W8P1_TILAU|nr:uncharacterized protein K437DRAFT_100831 [Tilletiaria anomala UBC 951]KDN47155.1 hypothetical protein K437DRAFT_100831 [Tilletiaria anomala UBC 951]
METIEIGLKLVDGRALVMDNGYIVFNRVGIPCANLARFQHIDHDGRYKLRNAEAKVLTRGITMLVRVGPIEIAAHFLSHGVLIAIRYAVVRR